MKIKNYEKMKKNELLEYVKELLEKVEELELANDRLEEYAIEKENGEAEASNNLYEIKENGIVNVDEYMFKLKIDNLYSEELEEFTRNYIKHQ